MKLQDVVAGTRGTYVGLRVMPPANMLMMKHCADNGIPYKQSMFESRLHTTLIYSRVYCPNLVVDPSVIYNCEFGGYDIFSGQNGEHVLVMLLKSEQLQERHAFLMKEHGATYDFPSYKPHITLSYNYTDNSVMGINPYEGMIQLGLEYTEDLDLNYGS